MTVKTWNIRDYTKDKHKKTDDYPYGGGSGLVMLAQPIYDAYEAVVSDLDYKPHFIYMSPQGKLLDQKLVEKLAGHRHLVILCGHYEEWMKGYWKNWSTRKYPSETTCLRRNSRRWC